jgi:integrase
MASYREVKNLWTARVRVKNHRPEFKGGFETKTDAKAWAGPVEERLRNAHDVKGLGPSKTTLAVALRDYAYAVTATQGGCVQALCKINKYLRAANFKPLKATKVRGGREFGLDGNGLPSELLQKVGAPLFKLTEQEDKPVFGGAKQKGFEGRRLKNLKREERAQRHREVMAKLCVSKIKAFHLTELVRLMNEDGFEAATQRQEDEAKRLAVSLPTCGNPDAERLVLFALETAMRRGEALWTACWCDVDYDNRVLKLPHAKTGRREVPLSPEAISMLQEMPQGAPTDTIFNLTDAALDSAWKRACKAAGIVNLRIHDLRHSSATMWADILHGDIFKLQLITSHRTLKMLQRYVNPKARQLAKQLQTITTPTIAATMRQQMAAAPPDDALASAVGGAPTPDAVQDEPNTPSCDVTLVLKDGVEEAVESPVPGDDRTSANVVSFATYRDKKQLRDAPPRVAAG